MLYCHECGRNIRISEDILKSGVRHYTQCNLYTRKGKYGICSSHRINYDWLEEDILEYLQDVCEKFCKYYDFNELQNVTEKKIYAYLPAKTVTEANVVQVGTETTKYFYENSEWHIVVPEVTTRDAAKEALQTFYEDLYNCELLIIDDLGTEVTNSFVTSQLFSCLNERALRRKAIIISTNLSLEELRDRYSERIFSRITTGFDLCKLTGPDIRIYKKRQAKK